MEKLKGKNFVRHGDVILRRIEAIPDGMERYQEDAKDRKLLALGEVTGHAHAIISKSATVYGMTPENLSLEKYLELKEEATLTHEEHGPIVLAPGNYRVTIQREYSPEEIRNVRD